MPIKALMIDIAGVIIVHPHPKGWSAKLEQDLGLSAKRIQQAFFRPHFVDILDGRAGMHERLGLVLIQIAPHLTPDTLIRYWFAQASHLDHDLLTQLAEVRHSGIALHLATNQEHERADYLWRGLELHEPFNAMHDAADLGCTKADIAFFKTVQARAGFALNELFLIDDRPVNIAAAQQAGWQAAIWTGRDSLNFVVARSDARIRLSE
jgi:putative hydrolase of the HAD superfamily